MMNNYLPLVHGIIDALIFLESAGTNELNPDSAVRCMETISASLLVLERPDQLALRSHLEEIAAGAKDPVYKKFVQKLPDMIGLASPS
jgi:hypothetical protein